MSLFDVARHRPAERRAGLPAADDRRLALGLGTLIALLASIRPAMRATRVPPIAAVREGAITAALALRALRTAGVALPSASSRFALLLLRRLRERPRRPRARDRLSIAGVLALFLGVALLAPRLVKPLAYVLGCAGRTLRRRRRAASRGENARPQPAAERPRPRPR